MQNQCCKNILKKQILFQAYKVTFQSVEFDIHALTKPNQEYNPSREREKAEAKSACSVLKSYCDSTNQIDCPERFVHFKLHYSTNMCSQYKPVNQVDSTWSFLCDTQHPVMKQRAAQQCAQIWDCPPLQWTMWTKLICGTVQCFELHFNRIMKPFPFPELLCKMDKLLEYPTLRRSSSSFCFIKQIEQLDIRADNKSFICLHSVYIHLQSLSQLVYKLFISL